jgi:hypothetical protein
VRRLTPKRMNQGSVRTYDDRTVSDSGTPYAGDPQHPDHPKYLTELGAAVYAAAGVAGIASDILRVHLGEDTMDLVDDPLGVLIKKLEQHDKSGSTIPGLTDFIVQLNAMLPMRNDVIHALPVAYGLHRRTKKDAYRVVNFYSIADLEAARKEFERVSRIGNGLLYFDGGKAVEAWTKG